LRTFSLSLALLLLEQVKIKRPPGLSGKYYGWKLFLSPLVLLIILDPVKIKRSLGMSGKY